MWDTEDFVPGRVATSVEFWWSSILPTCTPEQQVMYLRWLVEGVSFNESTNVEAEGVFQGQAYRGADLTPVELPNHVPPVFRSFMDETIDEFVRTGVVATWDGVADTALHPKPRTVQPLGVEPNKPRATYDARYEI